MIVVGFHGDGARGVTAAADAGQDGTQDGDDERSVTELVEQPAKVMRDRQHDQAAARGGQRGAARRGEPGPAEGDPPAFDQGARGRPGAGAGRGAGAALAAVHRGQRPRATPSCGSRRPSWSAGWRASSTASRRRCSPSRWRPARSSSRCAGALPPGVPGMAPGGRRPTAQQPSSAEMYLSRRAPPAPARHRRRRSPARPGRPPRARPGARWPRRRRCRPRPSIGRSFGMSPNATTSSGSTPSWSQTSASVAAFDPHRGDLEQTRCGWSGSSSASSPATSRAATSGSLGTEGGVADEELDDRFVEEVLDGLVLTSADGGPPRPTYSCSCPKPRSTVSTAKLIRGSPQDRVDNLCVRWRRQREASTTSALDGGAAVETAPSAQHRDPGVARPPRRPAARQSRRAAAGDDQPPPRRSSTMRSAATVRSETEPSERSSVP